MKLQNEHILSTFSTKVALKFANFGVKKLMYETLDIYQDSLGKVLQISFKDVWMSKIADLFYLLGNESLVFPKNHNTVA